MAILPVYTCTLQIKDGQMQLANELFENNKTPSTSTNWLTDHWEDLTLLQPCVYKELQTGVLNDQFVSVFTQEDMHNIPDRGDIQYPDLPRITIHPDGVRKLLHNINPHKATGPDNIPGQLLKEVALKVTPILSLIFSASLNQGRIPDELKEATVHPLIKRVIEERHPANYRPVSLTSITCKILEPILHSTIITHLDNLIWTSCQILPTWIPEKIGHAKVSWSS